MILKLLPTQIPVYWEIIKFVAIESSKTKEKNIPNYLNILLNSLLNEQSQCWIMYNESKMLQGMAITEIEISETQEECTCVLKGVHQFMMTNDSVNNEAMDFLIAFARTSNCDKISVYIAPDDTLYSKMFKFVGFKEKATRLDLEL